LPLAVKLYRSYIKERRRLNPTFTMLQLQETTLQYIQPPKEKQLELISTKESKKHEIIELYGE